MRFLLLSLLALLPHTALGDNFQGITIRNLDLKYELPFGKGQVEKVSLVLASNELIPNRPYPIEVERTETALVLKSQYLDLVWQRPLALLHNTERLTTTKANVDIGGKEHLAQAKYLAIQPKDQGLFTFDDLKFRCTGASRDNDFHLRMIEDCLNELSVVVKKIDVPADFLLADLQLPKLPAGPDIPGDDLKVAVSAGEFSLEVYIKYFLYAGLRAWGDVSFQNEREEFLINIHQIKFGYLPVTGLVMRQLRERIDHPQVEVGNRHILIRLKQ